MPAVPLEAGWVLANARLHAADPAMRMAKAVADGNDRWPAKHRVTLLRWETGAVTVTEDVVRRYESMLGLPEHQLAVTIELFARMHDPVGVTATLPRPGPPDRDATVDLLDRALGAERMSGGDWFTLSDHLGRMPHVLLRTEDWRHLIVRLLTEQMQSTYLDYALRTESVARLAGHPRSGGVVADLVTEGLEDGAAQYYNDLVGLLQFTRETPSVAMLRRQLEAPTNTHTLRAVLMVLTGLQRLGRLDLETSRAAARLALDHARSGTAPLRVQRGAANFIRALNLPNSERIALGLSVENRRLAAAIVRDGSGFGPGKAREVRMHLRRSVAAALPEADRNSAVLTGLVEATTSSNEDDRSTSLMLLMLMPQGRLVGRVYGRELAAAVDADDANLVHECLAVLASIVQPEDLDLLTGLALAPDASPDLVFETCVAIGNATDLDSARGQARDRQLAAKLDAVLRDPDSSGDLMEPTHRGLVYALGMHGRRDLLGESQRFLAAERPDHPAAAAIRWWLEVPEHQRLHV